MRVLGLSGSLRQDSHNTRLLHAAGRKLPTGTRLAVWEHLAEIPPFSEDGEDATPEPVRRLRSAIAGADAVLISTPEYNASVPGQLKNALDWVSRPLATNPLRGRPTAVVGASTGLFGAVWAQAELRKVLATIGADVLDAELAVGMADSAFTLRGDLYEPDRDAELGRIVDELLAAAGRRHAQVAA